MNTQLAEIPAAQQPAANDEFDHVVARLISTTRNSWAGEEFLSLKARIGVGLGHAALSCDGQTVYEERGEDVEALMTVAQAEAISEADPGHEWEIHLVALLDDRHYRRVAAGRWKLVRRGYGLS